MIEQNAASAERRADMADIPPGEGGRTARRPVKQQTIYLPIPVYEQLRRLAFDERVKMHALLMEGLDRVFRERGLPGVTDLKGPEAVHG